MMRSRSQRQANNAAATPRSNAAERSQYADNVPFFLRAWWLRDRRDYADLNFGESESTTGPLWCLHSDPLCDAGNMDSYQS